MSQVSKSMHTFLKTSEMQELSEVGFSDVGDDVICYLLHSCDLSSGFEQANQPTITDEDRRKVLHFCIVGTSMFLSTPRYLTESAGGGPTGVEFAAELHDLLRTDIERHYPHLAKLARISLFDVASSILGSFDEGLQEWVYHYPKGFPHAKPRAKIRNQEIS